jgi:hypothetical protein
LPLVLLMSGIATVTAIKGTARAQTPATDPPAVAPLKLAVITTVYRHNSHSDVIASRLFQTDTLDFKGRVYPMKIASLYVDQIAKNDTSREFSEKYKFPIYENIADALTLGTGKLAVDGVLLIAEHGEYPLSPTGNIEYPKRRMFEEIVKVFEASGRVVPIFLDKHIADNWTDAKWIYDTAQRLKIPMMAGSSLPVLWRYPAVDVPRDAELEQIVAVSYHTLTAYGFHALEMVQTLAERRKGGETGIKAVQTLEGDAVWEAGERGVYDPKLLEAAISRLRTPSYGKRTVREAAKNPSLMIIDYNDGLRASVLTLNGAANEWSVAWREKSGKSESTLFWTQEARPFQHFGFLLTAVEKMMFTGKPTYPVERTLLTSGALDALLTSKTYNGGRIETPHLNISYKTDWNWQMPPEPPPGRPIMDQ